MRPGAARRGGAGGEGVGTDARGRGAAPRARRRRAAGRRAGLRPPRSLPDGPGTLSGRPPGRTALPLDQALGEDRKVASGPGVPQDRIDCLDALVPFLGRGGARARSTPVSDRAFPRPPRRTWRTYSWWISALLPLASMAGGGACRARAARRFGGARRAAGARRERVAAPLLLLSGAVGVGAERCRARRWRCALCAAAAAVMWRHPRGPGPGLLQAAPPARRHPCSQPPPSVHELRPGGRRRQGSGSHPQVWRLDAALQGQPHEGLHRVVLLAGVGVGGSEGGGGSNDGNGGVEPREGGRFGRVSGRQGLGAPGAPAPACSQPASCGAAAAPPPAPPTRPAQRAAPAGRGGRTAAPSRGCAPRCAARTRGRRGRETARAPGTAGRGEGGGAARRSGVGLGPG
jgi:hypothetical protein